MNDGSTDNTLSRLNELNKQFPKQVEVFSYPKNKGKAEAVRTGILHCNDKLAFQYIAYLDADLAVSLQECLSLTQHFVNDIKFCFGSRILKLGSTIERRRSRFLIGRIIATLISELLSLKVYDTQCGCKLFDKDLSMQLFTIPFISKWLFDVEIFFRMYEFYGKEDSLTKMVEIPLIRWVDKGESKVKLSYFFHIFSDMYKMRTKYKHTLRE